MSPQSSASTPAEMRVRFLIMEESTMPRAWTDRATANRQGKWLGRQGQTLLIVSCRIGLRLLRNGFDFTRGRRCFHCRRLRLLFLLRQLLAVVVADHPRDIGVCLSIRRYTVVLLYPLRACVVGCQGLGGIPVILQEQLPQIANPTRSEEHTS